MNVSWITFPLNLTKWSGEGLLILAITSRVSWCTFLCVMAKHHWNKPKMCMWMHVVYIYPPYFLTQLLCIGNAWDDPPRHWLQHWRWSTWPAAAAAATAVAVPGQLSIPLPFHNYLVLKSKSRSGPRGSKRNELKLQHKIEKGLPEKKQNS